MTTDNHANIYIVTGLLNIPHDSDVDLFSEVVIAANAIEALKKARDDLAKDGNWELYSVRVHQVTTVVGSCDLD